MTRSESMRCPAVGIARGGSATRQRGAAGIEFFLAFTLVFLPLLMAIFEFSQLTAARHALAFAVFEAGRHAEAREGAITERELRTSLARALVPLFVGSAGAGEGNDLETADSAWTAALVASLAVSFNPTRIAIELQTLPVKGLEQRVVVTELKVRYCRELLFAPIKQLLPQVLRLRLSLGFDGACYEQQGVPLVATALITRSL